MTGPGLPVAIARACLRDGEGGSPTAVMEEAPLSDHERRRVPEQMGTSHAVFVSTDDQQPDSPVTLRFFTATGELPACGHGTVAALAFLVSRAGDEQHRYTLQAGGRTFTGWAKREGSHFTAGFDTGPVDLRKPASTEQDLILSALGIPPDMLAPGITVAAVGRSRILVPVLSRSAVVRLAPDLDRLRTACEQLDLLGCYVYSAPMPNGRIAARMFAPSIGVPEDIANANSTACLAAHLARQGITGIAVDMGDSLGVPATITATAQHGSSGLVIHVGGAAQVTDIMRLS